MASKKKRVGRPRTGQRPVIAIRVHEPLYAKIVAAAARLNLSISEEAERRLERSFEWERQFQNAEKLIADTRTAIAGQFESALGEKGYQRVQTDRGALWGEPGMDMSHMSISVDAAAVARAIEPELVSLIARTLQNIAKERNQS
jgi:hypothetical protein